MGVQQGESRWIEIDFELPPTLFRVIELGEGKEKKNYASLQFLVEKSNYQIPDQWNIVDNAWLSLLSWVERVAVNQRIGHGTKGNAILEKFVRRWYLSLEEKGGGGTNQGFLALNRESRSSFPFRWRRRGGWKKGIKRKRLPLAPSVSLRTSNSS